MGGWGTGGLRAGRGSFAERIQTGRGGVALGGPVKRPLPALWPASSQIKQWPAARTHNTHGQGPWMPLARSARQPSSRAPAAAAPLQREIWVRSSFTTHSIHAGMR